jgi:hypothetical protein
MNRMILVSSIFSGKRLLIASGIFIALAASFPAQASLLWDWSYTGVGIAASGIFTTDDAPGSGGYYDITGITGSRNGVAITSLEPAGDAIPGNAGFPVDNLITASGLLTSNGFGYETADGNYANPYYADFLAIPGFFEVFTEPASMGFSELPVDFTAAIVPEPGTAALVLAALVALVAFGRGRRDHRPCDAIPLPSISAPPAAGAG